MSKAVLEPKEAAEMAETARTAVEISISGRPGPVVVVMPRDFGEIDVAPAPEKGGVERVAITAGTPILHDLAKEMKTGAASRCL